MALGLSLFIPVFAQWVMGLLPGRDVEEQEEDAEAAASILFVTTHLLQTVAQWALRCKCSAHRPSLGTSRCSCRRYIGRTHPLLIPY